MNLRAAAPAAPVIVLLLVFVGLAFNGVAQESGTYDEYIHATAGFTYWTFDDYRIQPENGNWSQRLVALPAVLAGARFPSLHQEAWRVSDGWTLSEQFFFGGANDAGRLLASARVMVALVATLLGVLIFLWSRHLHGHLGGCISLLVFAFTPEMLAHGALATSDITATAFFLAATWALWVALHRTTWRTAAVSILATVGLFLSKFSALIFIPVALTMLIARLLGPHPRKLSPLGGLTAAHVIGVMLIIWASFGFRYTAFRAEVKGDERFIDPWSEVTDGSVPGRMVQAARAGKVLPEAYLFGMSTVFAYSKTRSAFLRGAVSQGGWRWFFPYAALVKSTIPSLLLGALVLVGLGRQMIAGRRASSEGRTIDTYALIPLLSLVGWYWLFAITSHLNIGYRHMLPAIAGMMVLTGAAAQPLIALRAQWSARTAAGRNKDVPGPVNTSA